MSKSATKPRLSALRRVILLVGAGALLATVVLTMWGAAPRQVTVTVLLADDARSRSSSSTVTADGETVFEAQVGPEAAPDGRLVFDLWLAPQQHQLEVQVRGCPTERRQFDPQQADRVYLDYHCEPSGSSR